MKSNNPDADFNTIVIWPSWVYGCKMGHIDNYLQFTLQDKAVNILGEGKNYCNFIHVEDLAELYYKIVTEGHN